MNNFLEEFINSNNGLYVDHYTLFDKVFPIGCNYYNRKNNIGFIYIPKNASRWAKYNIYFKKETEFTKEKQPVIQGNYYCFIRNPLKRFYSGLAQFTESFCLNQNTSKKYFIDTIFLQYIIPGLKNLDSTISLSDIHLRPQYQYLLPFEDNNITLYPLNNKSIDNFIDICQKLNIDVQQNYDYPDKKTDFKNEVKAIYECIIKEENLENNILSIYQQDHLLYKFIYDNHYTMPIKLNNITEYISTNINL